MDNLASTGLGGIFAGTHSGPPPIWLMRQAGRYLPEYRKVRASAGSFLDLCYAPALAAEVTMQPIRRYGFDAAILFSDILVVPDALGQPVRFLEGEGPVLDPITEATALSVLDPSRAKPKYEIVAETVARIREALPAGTSLIGFCGAPWTVATYMVEGKGSKDQAAARLWAYRDPEGFARLVDILTESSIEYLLGQVAAGADVLQIFDTWAGSLPDDEFTRWVIRPTQRIVAGVRERHPDIPIIGFPRGAGPAAYDYAMATGVDGYGCDTSMALETMSDLNERFESLDCIVQGNLDPLLLVVGGDALDRRIDATLEAMVSSARPFIFNLGHGIVPETPPENVARLVERVRRTAA